MLYLSQILARPIFDAEGERIAVVRDVIVRYGEEEYPPVLGLVARYRRRLFFMSRARISSLSESGVRMNSEVIDLKPFTRRAGEVLLAKDVLDNQLIDVDGKRVVRVNDVQLIEVAGEWRVSGADVSLQGFMRRLMPNGFYFAKRRSKLLIGRMSVI
jgi:sporulation protein YlmC with PRC-barrel domain